MFSYVAICRCCRGLGIDEWFSFEDFAYSIVHVRNFGDVGAFIWFSGL